MTRQRQPIFIVGGEVFEAIERAIAALAPRKQPLPVSIKRRLAKPKPKAKRKVKPKSRKPAKKRGRRKS